MVYTVTLNPSIDYVVRTEKFLPGEINTYGGEYLSFGGKGLNVSAVLAELGVKSKALGFTAGATGDVIERLVREAGVDADFVRLRGGISRINVKIKSGAETELNGKGPDIPEEKLRELFHMLDNVSEGDTLVLAGSIPPSLPKSLYGDILSRFEGSGVRTVVDASGEALRQALLHRPFLVKPNLSELGELFGTEITAAEQALEYAGKINAENVLISMAGDGAALLDEKGGARTCGVCRGTVRNSVGAGDSMVAGFLAGLDKGYDYALRLGTAAGGATAFSDGLAKREDIFALLPQLEQL